VASQLLGALELQRAEHPLRAVDQQRAAPPLRAGGTSSTGGTSASGSGSDAKPSIGCGKTPTLKNSSTFTANQNTLAISGTSRQFVMRWPTNYDSTHPYRLILDFHGAGGKDPDLAPSYFGLYCPTLRRPRIQARAHRGCPKKCGPFGALGE